MSSVPFILRRARRHWQILLTLGLGVVLTTALLASGPLLVDSVIEMGLHLTLQSSSIADANLRLVTTAPTAGIDLLSLDRQVGAILRDNLGDALVESTWSVQSQWMTPWLDGRPSAHRRVNIHTYAGIEDRLAYDEGGWPEEASGEPNVVRAVIADSMARSYSLALGDRLPLSLDPEGTRPELWIEVAGIARPLDPTDPFWFGEFSPLNLKSTDRWTSQTSAIVPAEILLPLVASLDPESEVQLSWPAAVRHTAISASDIEPFGAQLAELEAVLADLEPSVRLDTGLVRVLGSFQSQLESIRVPLYILVAEVMLLVLYYLTMAAGLAIRQVEREFAILRSRGTSGWQITRIQVAEALILMGIAYACGPWLGMGLVRGLSVAGPLADVAAEDWGVALNQSAWIAAGVGAVACLAGLILPLGPALRRSIVTHQQMVARGTSPPWWQRYYLDVFVLTGGLVLLWRLRLYGLMTPGEAGGTQLDWLLLLSPVAFLLGTATIMLRIFPLLLRGMAHIASQGQGLSGPFGLWQASRSPTRVTRLVLLLTLSIALGNLSTGLNTTLDQSERDRAHYQAGLDIRLLAEDGVPVTDLQAAAGVEQLSSTWRGHGVVVLESVEQYPALEVLGIRPETFAQTTVFRDDFSDQSMDELYDHLRVPAGEHPILMVLPGEPASFGLWLFAGLDNKAEMDSYSRLIDGDSDADRVGLEAKLQTAQGDMITLPLTRPSAEGEDALLTDRFSLNASVDGRETELRFRITPDTGGWHYFQTPLPHLPAESYPLSLHSLWFQNQATRQGEPIPKPIILLLDDLTVVDRESGQTLLVEDLESSDRTLFLNIQEPRSIHDGLYTNMVDSWTHSGDWSQGIYTRVSRPLQTLPLRMRASWRSDPLPALVSPAFLDATQLREGDLFRTWINATEIDFQVKGVVRYFPTMYDQEDLKAGYLITSRDLLLALMNETWQPAVNPNEALIRTDGNTSLEALAGMVPTLDRSWQAESEQTILRANPLALGLRSVTYFGSVLTILLSLVGFATHFYLSVRQRETLYGVMRAMGMSSRQLYRSIAFEQAVILVTGLLLGTGLGVILNQITLPRLPVSLGERPPIPPFAPHEDWLAIMWLSLTLALAFMVILAAVTALLRRAQLHRVLRIGQE